MIIPTCGRNSSYSRILFRQIIKGTTGKKTCNLNEDIFAPIHCFEFLNKAKTTFQLKSSRPKKRGNYAIIKEISTFGYNSTGKKTRSFSWYRLTTRSGQNGNCRIYQHVIVRNTQTPNFTFLRWIYNKSNLYVTAIWKLLFKFATFFNSLIKLIKISWQKECDSFFPQLWW